MAETQKTKELEQARAQITELQRSETERKRMVDLLTEQRSLTVSLAASTDLTAALDRLLEMALKLESIDCGGVYLLDERSGELNLAVHQGLPPAFVESTGHYSADSPQTRLVMKGELLYQPYSKFLPDVQDEARMSEGLRAVVVVPVLHGKCIVAAMNLASHEHDEIPRCDLDTLQAISAQLGGVIARLKAEAQLRASQENFESLFTALDDFLFVLDAQAQIVHVNPVVVEKLGYTREELAGMSVAQVHPPERRKEAIEIVDEMLEGKRDFCPIPLMTRDGACIPVETRVVLGKWNDQEAIFGISRDITERKRAEEIVRESEERFRMAFESSGISKVLTKLDGGFFRVNAAICNMMGYTEQEMLSMSFRDITHSDDLAESAEYVAKLLQGELEHDKFILEKHYVRKDGDIIKTKVNVSLVRNQQDEPIHMMAELEDITERKQAEEELERYRDRLEDLVQERTQKLREAQAELLRKERLSALGQLTTTVAHEIRNPLGTVRTAVFAIGDAVERNELHRIKQARRLAERNIIRCDNIIRELLDYTRDRVLQLKPTQIDAWLDVVLDEQNIPENIICTRELISGVKVLMDSEYLRRAVINVVENAIDALQDEGASGNRLTVSTRVAGSRLEIRIGDTGCGVPADVLDKIFEPLFSTKTFGVGLGLSVVKNIMTQHGGGVEVQSEVGRGSTVTLWLPTITLWLPTIETGEA